MLLLFVLVAAGARGWQDGPELIRSRAHHRGDYYCMRSPGDAEGAGVQLAVCNPKDTRQLWWRNNNGGTRTVIAAYDNNMLLTLRNGREATGNPVEQRSSIGSINDNWTLESSGRIKLAITDRLSGSRYSVHADLSNKRVVVRKHHNGSKHQAWDFIPAKKFTPAMARNEGYKKIEKGVAYARKWAKRYGRRLLAATAQAGRLSGTLEE